MEHRQSRRGFIGGLVLAGAGLGAGLILPEPAGAVPLSNVHAYVSNPGGHNLRTAPNWSATVIKTLPTGTPLNVLATAGDWFKVYALGRTGYVNSWRVTLTGTPSTVIARGNTSRKQVALTFDCGSDRGYIVKILALLQAWKIKGSFGLTGAWVQANPSDALAIAQAGHQPINHTLDHPSFTGYSTGTDPISPAFRLSRLVGNESVLANAGVPKAMPYWRPPYGDYDNGVLRDVGAAGYSKTIMWTVDTLGWNGATVNQIHDRVMSAAKWGMIVLMHVGADSQDAYALDRIISDLKDQGYGFGTVAQVIAP